MELNSQGANGYMDCINHAVSVFFGCQVFGVDLLQPLCVARFEMNFYLVFSKNSVMFLILCRRTMVLSSPVFFLV